MDGFNNFREKEITHRPQIASDLKENIFFLSAVLTSKKPLKLPQYAFARVSACNCYE